MTWAPRTPSPVPGLSLLEDFQPGEPGDSLSHPKGLDASPRKPTAGDRAKALFMDVGAGLGPSLERFVELLSPHAR